MNNDEYLRKLLSEKANGSFLSQEDLHKFAEVSGWFTLFCRHYELNYNIYMHTKVSMIGARANGTSLKGKSDMDILATVTGYSSMEQPTTKELFSYLLYFLKRHIGGIRINEQLLSYRIDFDGYIVHLTPSIQLEKSSYKKKWVRYYDQTIYSRRTDSIITTNFHKHIDLVRNSGLQEEIMCVKLWRDCHNLELPSMYIYALAIEVITEKNKSGLFDNVSRIISYLTGPFPKAVFDPSNPENELPSQHSLDGCLALTSAAQSFSNNTPLSELIW